MTLFGCGWPVLMAFCAASDSVTAAAGAGAGGAAEENGLWTRGLAILELAVMGLMTFMEIPLSGEYNW